MAFFDLLSGFPLVKVKRNQAEWLNYISVKWSEVQFSVVYTVLQRTVCCSVQCSTVYSGVQSELYITQYCRAMSCRGLKGQVEEEKVMLSMEIFFISAKKIFSFPATITKLLKLS